MIEFHNSDSLEEFYSTALIVCIPHSSCSADVGVALDDDGQEGAEHDHRLERVGPHDGLDAALKITTIKHLNFPVMHLLKFIFKIFILVLFIKCKYLENMLKRLRRRLLMTSSSTGGGDGVDLGVRRLFSG